MRYPPFLPPNGTIGFVAPSFGVAMEPYLTTFQAALDRFHAMGYATLLGPNVYEGSGIGISSTPQACGEELTEYYCRPDCNVLISCGGGELMCEDLEFVDFEAVKAAPPKWYMGFSDNTNFTFLLTTLCDVASIYGPCAGSFGMKPWHPAIQDAMDVLTGETTTVHNYDYWQQEVSFGGGTPCQPYLLTTPYAQRQISQGSLSFSGRLIGGCLDCLVNFSGTEFDRVAQFAQRYQEDGVIWFLESCDLNVMGIRRALWQLEHTGWFQNVKGFLIGRPLCYGQELMGLDAYTAVSGILSKYNVPILFDLDFGHLPPQMPLICGSLATVSAGDNRIEIQMKLE